MESKHKKIRKRRIPHTNSNNYYRNFPVDNSKYIKVLIVISIYVFIATLLYDFFIK